MFKIATIDFEATALSNEGDPIEVGVAIYDRQDLIQTWSSLIRPGMSCLWDETSAAVHKIARTDLSLLRIRRALLLNSTGSWSAYRSLIAMASNSMSLG
jgi:hypothetical protein